MTQDSADDVNPTDRRAADAPAEQDAPTDGYAPGEVPVAEEETKKRRKGGALREIAVIAVIALTLSFLVKTFIAQPFYIPSQSMENTLDVGDRIVVSKFTPQHSPLHRGDVVVFSQPTTWGPPPPESTNQLKRVVKDTLTFIGVLRRRRTAPGQAAHRPAGRSRGLHGAEAVGQRRGAQRAVPEAGIRAVRDRLLHHRPPGEDLGDGRQPQLLLRLPRTRRRHRTDRISSGVRHHRPGGGDRLAAQSDPELAGLSVGLCQGAQSVTSSRKPSLRVERALQREGYQVLAGMDEVGRGALAGPVSVGVVLIDERTRSAPAGVRDSKLLTPAAREAMVPRVQRWALEYAVGHASALEIDQIGIIAALRLAGRRALAHLTTVPDLVILDGKHDWLSDPAHEGLLALVSDADPAPPVRTMIKADMRCSSVAAASVIAKVERDAILVRLHDQYPQYNWAGNKGYSAPDHLAALDRHGPCELHRRSWRRFVAACDQVELSVPAAQAHAGVKEGA